MKRSIFFVSVGISVFSVLNVQAANPYNFSRDSQDAELYGTHEIRLLGNGSVANPFDALAQVEFTRPDGSKVLVPAFYDGGNVWRARAYANKLGTWNWKTISGVSFSEGSFVVKRERSLRGMLRKHKSNPRRWMTDNGRTFIPLFDTAYLLLSETNTPIFEQYVDDNVAMGITGLRCHSLGSFDWDMQWVDGDATTGPRNKINVSSFQRTDYRLEWLLDTYPNLQVQMILFPDGNTKADSPFWKDLPGTSPSTDAEKEKVRQRLLRYMVARWSAFPNVFFETTNDTYLGTSSSSAPKAWFWAENVGNYFFTKDPWNQGSYKRPMAFGHRRDQKYPFANPESYPWNTFIPGYGSWDLDAAQADQYSSDKNLVFYQEDYYEEDPFNDNEPDHPDYFYRWQAWSWILSGGGFTYGGDINHLQDPGNIPMLPYSTSGLKGLKSINRLKRFFEDRSIDLALYEPKDSLSSRSDELRPQVMRKVSSGPEFIVYYPNATRAGEAANLATTKAASFNLNLSEASSSIRFESEWVRAVDGVRKRPSTTVTGGGTKVFSVPTSWSGWVGQDVVLRLSALAAPVVSFKVPLSGQVVSGSAYSISINAKDNIGISGVKLQVDGVDVGAEDTSSPYAFTWDTTALSNGIHTLKVVARDAVGQTGTASVLVEVAN